MGNGRYLYTKTTIDWKCVSGTTCLRSHSGAGRLRDIQEESTMKPAQFLLALAVALAVADPSFAQSNRASKSRRGGRGRAAAKAAPAWPAFEARHDEWVRRRESAAAAGLNGPDPLTQYLVAEVIVSGVYDTDTGFGVFLHASPSGNTFFATPGSALYNGRLLEIVPAASGFSEDIVVVFAERTGKSGEERRVTKRIEAAPGPTAPEAPPAPEQD
jgi:hypothetical protein